MAKSIPSIWGTLDPFVETGPVIGRKVANSGFLRALFDADPYVGYHFFLLDQASGEAVGAFVRQCHPQILPKIKIFPRASLPSQIASAEYHCFHLSDCLTSQGFLAAVRNRVARNVFPITGMTHSLSYARYGQAFAQHVWPGTTDRDCIVATSRAGADVVRTELGMLRGSMADARVPHVAVIPLGVQCDEFAFREGETFPRLLEPRTVFLVPGRISPYSKMDLLPLLRAFQRLRQSGVDLSGVSLVLAGSASESVALPGTLVNLAANIGLAMVVVDCPDDVTKRALFQRADVVVSLADNPQETFGLTILEAAAAGKPVIASDYDGYRDLVRHGETGFLVPTMDGGVTEDISLLAPLLYDSEYHLWLAQDVAVDVDVLAMYLRTLLQSDVRDALGQAGRQHAARFDWSRIVDRYVELWDELAKAPAPAPGKGACRHPLSIDYCRVFAGYPSGRLSEKDVLECTQLGQAVYRGRDFPVIYAGIEVRIQLDLMRKILVWARHPLTWGKLKDMIGEDGAATVMWMLKSDLLCRRSAESD